MKSCLQLKIGQHFNDIFGAFDIIVPDFDEFITIYKENYFEQIQYSTLYDGVEETLSELKNRGAKDFITYYKSSRSGRKDFRPF